MVFLLSSISTVPSFLFWSSFSHSFFSSLLLISLPLSRSLINVTKPSANEQSLLVFVCLVRIFPEYSLPRMTVGKRRTYKYLSTDENVVPTADRRSSRHERLAAKHVAVQRNTNNRYFIMLTRCDFQFSMGGLVVVKVFQVIERISRKHVHSRPQPSRHSSMFMQSPTIKRNVIVRAALRSGNATSPRESPLAGDTWKFPCQPRLGRWSNVV